MVEEAGKSSVEHVPGQPAPDICGVVVSVNVSDRKGVRKKPTESGSILLDADYGVEGDAHAGNWHRQVSFLARESIDKAVARGLDVKEGDFAENITTRGFVPYDIPVGTRLKVGEALVEISQIGKVCHAHCAIYKLAGDCIFPREGIFGWVVEPGEVKVGDKIQVVAWGDGTCDRTPQEALDEISAVRAAEKQARCGRIPGKDLRFSVVTTSDTRTLAEDTAGAALEELIRQDGWTVSGHMVCKDDRASIAACIVAACEEQGADVVVTCGGSGLSPRDVTPEATGDVCERDVPGIAEAMRAYSLKLTGRAMLSRPLHATW